MSNEDSGGFFTDDGFMRPEQIAAYPLSPELLGAIEAQRTATIERLEVRLARLRSMSPIDYAREVGIGHMQEGTWAGCFLASTVHLTACPDKGQGQWLLETDREEWYVSHEQVLSAFPESGH